MHLCYNYRKPFAAKEELVNILKKTNHTWSTDDDLIVYCLYRLGNQAHTLGIEPAELSQVLGMSFDSLNYKLANFKAIDGLGGMKNYTKQSERVAKQYSLMPDTELRTEGINAVQRALDKYTNGDTR